MRTKWLGGALILFMSLLAIQQVEFTSDPTAFFSKSESEQDRQFFQVINGMLDSTDSVAQEPLMLAVSLPEFEVDKLNETSHFFKNKLVDLDGVDRVVNEIELITDPKDVQLFNYRYLLVDNDWSKFDQQLKDLWQRWQWELGDKQALLTDPVQAWNSYLKHAMLKSNFVVDGDVLAHSSSETTELLFIIYLASNDALPLVNKQLIALANQNAGSEWTWSSSNYLSWYTRIQIEQRMLWISVLSIVLLFGFLLWRLRSLHAVAWVFIPLLGAAALSGWVVSVVFGGINPIALALGMVLLGVTVDYPIHILLSRAGRYQAWRGVRLALITTLLGYLSLFFLNNEGLQQLAVFATGGLLISLLLIRLLVYSNVQSGVVSSVKRKTYPSKEIQYIGWLIPGLVVLVFFFKPIVWQDDLAALSPVSASVMENDGKLRAWFGQPQIDQLLLVRAKNDEQLRERLEELEPKLEQLKSEGVLGDSLSLANWLPSTKRQLERQHVLPENETLSTRLTELAIPLQPKHFEGFFSELDQIRHLPVLDLTDLKQHAMDWQKAMIPLLIFEDENQVIGRILLSEVKNSSRLAVWAEKNEVSYLIQRQFIKEKTSRLRLDIINLSVLLMGLLLLGLTFSYRRIKPVLTIGGGVLLGVLITLGTLNVLISSFSVFHLIALLLVMGMGVDYGIFAEQAKRLKTDLVSVEAALMTSLLTFSLLLFSGVPLLIALGQTLIVGVLAMYGSARLIQRI